LQGHLDTGRLLGLPADKVMVSAKVGSGIDSLVRSIERICGLFEIEAGAAVCFTERQEELLRQLRGAKTEKQSGLIIRELLSGPLSL
jgi:HPt (histidine-containing phosphotransfer) domain-containing protein